MEDATLFDELAYYIGEEEARAFISIINALKVSPRIVSVKGHYIVEIQKTLTTPREYSKTVSLLAEHYVPIPPSGGRAIYLRIGKGYAVVAILQGMKLQVILAAKGEEYEERGNNKNG